jgi:hypothetical protein
MLRVRRIRLRYSWRQAACCNVMELEFRLTTPK